MNFNNEQQMILDTVRQFVDEKVIPVAGPKDEAEEFPRELFQQMADMGLTGLMIPEEFGGAGLDTVSYTAVVEEIGRGWVALGGAYTVHMMVSLLLLKYGSQEQKQKYLPLLTSGRMIGAIAMTEPQAGSDLSGIISKAESCDQGFKLQGSKIFITTGGEAELYLVLMQHGTGTSLFIVEKGTEGFSFGKKEHKMGYGGSPTRELIFEDCVIPPENLVGEEGKGLNQVLKGLDSGRVGVAAMGVGLARAALEYALQYMRERKQFGKPISEFQGLQFMVADLATAVAASRQLVYLAAEKKDRDEPFTMEASMAKLFATETAMRVTTDAVQLLGGYGYIKDYPVERFMREAKMLQIVEGTNQIQKVVIFRNLK